MIQTLSFIFGISPDERSYPRQSSLSIIRLQKPTVKTLKLLCISSLLSLFSLTVDAQFKDDHKYVIGGSLQASKDLNSLSLKLGKVLTKGNLLGLSGYANGNTSGVSGWYRITRELESTSFPVFYKIDTELGYFRNENFVLSISPGFTIPISKRTYLDLSLALLQFTFNDELDAHLSLNNIGAGLVFGI